MTLNVQVGLAIGSVIPSTYFILDSPVQGVLDVNVLAPADALADLTGRHKDLQVDHQFSRTGPLIEYSARTCTLTLLNDDGALDPATLEAAGLQAPGAILAITKEHAGVVYPVFYGTIDSWLPEHRYPTHAVVSVTATDGFSLLEANERTELALGVGAGELTGARVNRILDAANWPAAARDIAAGDTALQATTMPGTAQSELQTVNRNEVGEYYIAPDGRVTFRNRQAIVTDSRSATSQATFGSGVGEIPYVGRPGTAWDKGQLVNTVRATRAGGTQQTAVDAASVARNGTHAPGDTELLVQTDVEALAWAQYVVAQDAKPEFRFTSLELECVVDPDTLFPQALGRRFGDLITVVRRPPGVVDSRAVFIRSVSHTWTSDRPEHWKTSWGLQPATKTPLFVLDSATNGVLDVNVLGY